MDPIKALSQLRSNPFVKLASAATQPLRKAFKTHCLSEQGHGCEGAASIKSTATEETVQVHQTSNCLLVNAMTGQEAKHVVSCVVLGIVVQKRHRR
jgi:hypothetical protein